MAFEEKKAFVAEKRILAGLRWRKSNDLGSALSDSEKSIPASAAFSMIV